MSADSIHSPESSPAAHPQSLEPTEDKMDTTIIDDDENPATPSSPQNASVKADSGHSGRDSLKSALSSQEVNTKVDPHDALPEREPMDIPPYRERKTVDDMSSTIAGMAERAAQLKADANARWLSQEAPATGGRPRASTSCILVSEAMRQGNSHQEPVRARAAPSRAPRPATMYDLGSAVHPALAGLQEAAAQVPKPPPEPMDESSAVAPTTPRQSGVVGRSKSVRQYIGRKGKAISRAIKAKIANASGTTSVEAGPPRLELPEVGPTASGNLELGDLVQVQDHMESQSTSWEPAANILERQNLGRKNVEQTGMPPESASIYSGLAGLPDDEDDIAAAYQAYRPLTEGATVVISEDDVSKGIMDRGRQDDFPNGVMNRGRPRHRR